MYATSLLKLGSLEPCAFGLWKSTVSFPAQSLLTLMFTQQTRLRIDDGEVALAKERHALT
jgi:hypothetical protein